MNQSRPATLGAGAVCARYLVRRRDERGLIQSRVITLMYQSSTGEVSQDLGQARSAIESALEAEINNWLPSRQSRIGLSISLVGLHR
jgi:hypothetical protein